MRRFFYSFYGDQTPRRCHGPAPLQCNPPMVPNKKRTACACPEGTEFKNGKCVKKSSLFEDILGHVSIGVGVGVGGGRGNGSSNGGEHPPRR